MASTLKRPANLGAHETSKLTAKVGTKRPLKVQDAPPARRRLKAAPKPAKPFLRFYHSESLRAKTLGVLHDLESAEDGTVHRKALAEIVVELTDSGMDCYFLKPLKLANVGFISQQSANLGMAATTRVLGSAIRSIIGGMDKRQLLVVCGYIRQLME